MLFNHVSGRLSHPVTSGVPVIVYGTIWHTKTRLLRQNLDSQGIPYSFVDLDTNPEAEAQLRWLTGGFLLQPTVYIGEQVLVAPDATEIKQAMAHEAV